MIKNIELEKGAYQFDAKMPLRQAIPLGLQHVFAMFVGNLTPLLIITSACGLAGGEFADLQVSLLQNAMFVAGVVTLVQLFSIGPVGGQVPIIMGTSSGFLGVFNSVAASMGGGVLAYNGGKIVDCVTGEALYQVQLGAEFVPELCEFAARQDVAILTYNSEGIVCERDQDVWANKECFTTKLPMLHGDDLASYVDYPICKMLITLDPARRDAVCAAGKEQFAGRIDLYPSSPFFIEAVPLGVAKDRGLAALLERMGLTRENLMACGDGLNDRSMISYAGVGVAMQNAEDAVKAVADYVTAADNNHDGVAEAIEKFILN